MLMGRLRALTDNHDREVCTMFGYDLVPLQDGK